MQTEFDIVIVGGGLAGNCLALALQHTTLSIAIIEAQTPEILTHAVIGDRALALAAGTVDVLRQLNAWQGIEDEATAIKNIHVSDKGHFGKVRLSAEKENVDALGYVITARPLETHISYLTQQSGATVFCPARVTSLISDEKAVFLSLKQNDSSLNIKAKLVVGADGGHSSVRNLLSISQSETDYGQTALVTTIKSSLSHKNTAYERFTASGPLALLPLKNNHSAVVWTRTHEEAEALMLGGEADFIEQLQICFGYKLGQLELTAPRRAFPLSLIRAEKMIAQRAVILGNAAHQLHPVAGQGFNLGLRDVIVLADFLKKSQNNVGDFALLKQFETARLPDHNKTIYFTDSIVKLFSQENAIFSTPRNIGLTLLDHLPFAKTKLAQHAMGFTPLKNYLSPKHEDFTHD